MWICPMVQFLRFEVGPLDEWTNPHQGNNSKFEVRNWTNRKVPERNLLMHQEIPNDDSVLRRFFDKLKVAGILEHFEARCGHEFFVLDDESG